jgi:hypothetical protein
VRGLTKRQPRAVSCTTPSPRAGTRVGLANANGARLMDSTPPATYTSASPRATAREASATASSPLPHNRLTVHPATDSGKPASSKLIRATSRLSSPAWLPQPK